MTPFPDFAYVERYRPQICPNNHFIFAVNIRRYAANINYWHATTGWISSNEALCNTLFYPKRNEECRSKSF